MNEGMYDKINEMLTDAVREIFTKIQNECGIQYGECPWNIEYDIDSDIESLTEDISKAVAANLA